MPRFFAVQRLQFRRILLFPLYSVTIVGVLPNCTRKFYASSGIASSEVSRKGEWDDKSDGFMFVQMMRNCTKTGNVSYGEQLHCYALRSGFASDVYVSTSLVSFYAKVVCVDDAHKVFDEMAQLNVVSWNALISGYVRSGKLSKALSSFTELNRSEIKADAYSVTSALAACGQLRLLVLGMSIHSRVVVYGLESSVAVSNSLIDMYGKCVSVEGSIGVFDKLLDKDVISWNSVIAACARNRRFELAFDYFDQTPFPNTVTYNILINGVSLFGEIDKAIDILRIMPKPNSSSWNSILSGYVVRNRAGEALEFLVEMHGQGVIIDEFTFSSILSGIASISALRWGTLIHCCTIKCGLIDSTIIGSALIDMYSKCGQGNDAEALFHCLPRKNIVTWNAMLSGLAHNGESVKVVQYFEDLKNARGLKPDDVTFINVLAACSHNQMPLEKAHEYLDSMINDYGIKPMPEHLTSVIRLTGHHGQLRKAMTMIDDFGFGSCAAVWRALLGACGTFGDLEIAKVAAKRLSRLESHDEFGYVTLNNLNKSRENWEDANTAWEAMKDEGVAKEAGFSWIEGREP